MKYIECPNEYNLDDDDPFPSVFLAGGITGCEDWQSELSKLLENTNYIVFNPRRQNFNLAESRPQIEWEYKYLNSVDVVSFYFSDATLCPITLFELGSALEKIREYLTVFVACHPNYKRREDVIIQCELINKDIVVVSTIKELSEQLIKFGESF